MNTFKIYIILLNVYETNNYNTNNKFLRYSLYFYNTLFIALIFKSFYFKYNSSLSYVFIEIYFKLLKSNNYYILCYWIIILPISLILIEYIKQQFHLKHIIQRKLFHLIAILIYIPGIKYMDSDLLLCISFIVLNIFLALEYFRNINYLKSLSFINKINTYLLLNIDERDSKELILTHTFLLFGCFSSVFYFELFNGINNYNKHKDFYTISELKFVGIIVLGVGDSMVIYKIKS